jgi:3-hydroxybutyrate dehydrogenase
MLKGKTAIVTGSTSGIGLGIAEKLAAAGAHVMLNGLGDKAEIQKIVDSLAQTHKVKVGYSDADMTKPSQIATMVQEANSLFGSVDILVNNAGIQHTSPVESFPDDKWDAIIAINLSALFHTIKAALPGMQQRNFGRIINIASAHGLVASAHKVAYVSAKHGVVGMTKVVALENAPHDITCNAICPGWVLTPLVEKQIKDNAAKEQISFEDAKMKLLAEKQPSLRFVAPDDIGDLVLFLCSKAGSSVTGTTLSIDGGWTAQ